MVKRGKAKKKKAKKKQIQIPDFNLKEKLKNLKFSLPKFNLDNKKVKRFFKLTKSKITVLISIVAISLLFQVWDYNKRCLEIICEPVFLGVLYYVLWPFELLVILLVGNIPPNKFLLSIIKIIFLVLQVGYWYLLACLVAYPINKTRGKINIRKSRRRKEADRIMNIKIKKDLEQAEELEKERIRKTANVF